MQQQLKQVVAAGANVLVAGSYVFGSKDVAQAMPTLKEVRNR